MTTAEKYRQQFAAKAEIFTQLLPYAIVFGCVTMWAKAFEGIDTSISDNWYVGAGPFQAALLASSLQSMNANISSAISFSPPSSGSSSGFGGGGFSGVAVVAAGVEAGERRYFFGVTAPVTTCHQ